MYGYGATGTRQPGNCSCTFIMNSKPSHVQLHVMVVTLVVFAYVAAARGPHAAQRIPSLCRKPVVSAVQAVHKQHCASTAGASTPPAAAAGAFPAAHASTAHACRQGPHPPAAAVSSASTADAPQQQQQNGQAKPDAASFDWWVKAPGRSASAHSADVHMFGHGM